MDKEMIKVIMLFAEILEIIQTQKDADIMKALANFACSMARDDHGELMQIVEEARNAAKSSRVHP
jgi:hypothetical protein